MLRSRRRWAPVAILAFALVTTSCGIVGGGDSPDFEAVFDSEVQPVDLELPAPAYAVGTRQGLVVRAGEARRVFPQGYTLEWLPGGRALVYHRNGRQVRIWNPADDSLSPPTALGRGVWPIQPGALKRSVTQIDLSTERRQGDNLLRAYDLDLTPRWETPLPGPDDEDPDAGSGSGFVRGYQQGHTIDGLTYLMWSDFDPHGEESEPHYGLLRVDPRGKVLDQVQVDQRITSTWLSADGAALLALRRTSGHPCGGCEVDLELVELNPATGEIAADYDMPPGYDESWSVVEVDKVGDRVAVRFESYPEGEPPYLRLRGTWVRDDDGWAMLPGSREEITWWQGPDQKIVARLDPAPARSEGSPFRLFRVYGEAEVPIPGRLEIDDGRRAVFGAVPGQALPPP